MKRPLTKISIILLATLLVYWWLSRPQGVPETAFASLDGDAARGETVFWASGCASCHAAPKAEGDDKLVLSGGYRMESPFGTFLAPNISPGPEGLGGWSTHDLANALIAGISPNGRHVYPALPYTSYSKMTPQDVADLKAFLDTLPISDTPNQPHELGFPFTIRRGLGLWKQLNYSREWVVTEVNSQQEERGRYLVEALGHCAECHTPRTVMGGLDTARWMQGAPNPSGKGNIPPISPDKLDWSVNDIAYYLESGFTPDFDSAGGQMANVISGTARLSPEDRLAMATFLKLQATKK